MPLPYKPSEYVRPKGTAATHPDDRRAGCPHPVAPRAGANVSILNHQCAAGVNARPTKPENCRGQPGNCGPALQQTPVGDDSISAREPRGITNARPPGKRYPRATTNLCRGRCLHRPAHPAAAQTPAGGINPAPTNKFCVSGQTGTAATTRTTVGRDALIPPHPAAAQTPRADMESAPTDDGERRGPAHHRPLTTPPPCTRGLFCRFFTKTPRFICRICAAARPSGKILQPFGAARGFHGRPFMV